MLSTLELRQIIESGFVPLSCTCTVSASGYLKVEVFEPKTGRVDLMVDGIATANLTSARSIANLIGDLRREMADNRQQRARASA